MDSLFAFLIAAVIIAAIAWGLLWACNKFFPEFPPARWICGVVVIILILGFATGRIPVPFGPFTR